MVPSKQAHDAGIDYELFLDCVHCGLCTSSCPTYVELGDENDSPRGRIYLMRAVTDGRLELDRQVAGHLELCLDCRACETACPSGVQYGKLIEPFRVFMGEQEPGRQVASLNALQRWMLFHIFPSRTKTCCAHPTAQYGQTEAATRSAPVTRACTCALRRDRAAAPRPSVSGPVT